MSARSRRDLENRELAQLAESLPLASAITAQLDKASVIRLTSAYLSLRRIFPHFEDVNDELIEVGSFLLQTLDGFVLILDPHGKMMYVSETASVHLGLSQVELIGASIFDFLHRDDEPELRYILSCVDSRRLNTIIPYTEEIERMFFVRLRCVLPKRNAGITYNGYKTISCWGYSKIYHDHLGSTNMGLIAVGYMLSRSGVTEMKLSPSMFMFRARLDLNIIFIDSRITALTGFAASSLLDISLYHIVLLDDAHIIERAHRILLNKNQSTTGYYRMLHKGTGYVWVQSQFCIVPMLRATVSHCIVAITEVFSAREDDQTLALVQKCTAKEPTTPSTTLGEYSNLFYKGAPAVSSASQHSTPDT
uniref:PAS domain-containing protein n=1 Tax=Parascaris univalens TaxID=6257 RepID=A0A915B7M9_PARUN